MQTQKSIAMRNGIIRAIPKDERNYYIVTDVQQILGISRGKAYQIIRALRLEMIASGRLVPEYPAGRVPKKYFDARCAND